MAACTREVRWYYHIAVSLVTFLGGVLLLLPARALWYYLHKKRKSRYNRDTGQGEDRKPRHPIMHCCSRLRANAQYVLSGHATFSKVVITFTWLVNLACIVLYLVEAAEFSVDRCGYVFGDLRQNVWLALSCFLIAHYIIRFLAAPDKFFMWIDLYSVVDHFTIGPIFMGLYLNSNWLGLKFLRLLYLLQLPEVLQLMHVLKTKNTIRVFQAGTIFLACWMTSAGFVHITENNGDPHHNYENYQELTYWDCLYWLLVTMSTVGFGEIYPTTDIGRAFIIIFIMGSFAMFTSIIPELVRSLGRQSQYQKPYKRTYGKKHIVVCGHVTTESVSSFIKNFLHEDAAAGNIDVVFLDMQKPCLELEAFFKRHYNDVRFVQGTAMDLKALRSVKLRDADACLILANRQASDPDEEDAANIMRATAIKNFHADIRVIIQLLQYHNKMSLLHIPNWKWDKTDSDAVVCVSELKNGVLAQNCLAPGVATLLSNLFTMRSYKHKKTKDNDWLDAYKYGAGHEIYAMEFSPAFVGMTFSQAAEICYARLGVLLLAVDVSERQRKTRLKVNPGTSVVITADCTGFFVAQTPEQVHAVTTFSAEDPNNVAKTYASNGKVDSTPTSVWQPLSSSHGIGLTPCHYRHLVEVGDTNRTSGTQRDKKQWAADAEEELNLKEVVEDEDEEGEEIKDEEEHDDGSSHLVVLSGLPSEISLASSVAEDQHLEYLEGVGSRLANFGSQGQALDDVINEHAHSLPETFDISGMVHWCMGRKLEDCILTPEEIRDRSFSHHVVMCLNADANSPETCLVNFVMPLRASSFQASELKDIVIVAHREHIAREWSGIANFPNVYVVERTHQRRLDLRLVNIQQCDMCVILTAGKSIRVDQTMLDKEAILTTLSIKAMCGVHLEERIKSFGVLTNPAAFRRQMAVASEVPLITELEHEGNVSFVDADDVDDPSMPLFLTTPYMCGTTFVTSVLDSLLSCTYLNGDVLTLIRALVTGGETAEFEKVLAVGLGIVRKNTLMDVSSARQRCRLAQLSLSYGPLEKLQHKDVYGELFVQAVRRYNMVCMGVHRLMNPESTDPRRRKRVVLSNPVYETKLLPSDRIYVLQPYEMSQSGPRTEDSDEGPITAPSSEDEMEHVPSVRFNLSDDNLETKF